jgi:DNA polymerase phi
MDADDLDDSLEVSRPCYVSTKPVADMPQAVTGAASRMFVAAPAKKSKKARKSTDAEQDPDAPPALDTLVDVIIGFLEESTAYMRTVANQVFASLSTAVKQQETLGLILTVR